MAQKPETVFRARAMKDLKEIPNSWWESIQQKTIKGTPDILGCLNGAFIAIEFKSDEGVPSKIQEHKLCAIRDAGGFGIVVWPDDWPEVFGQLKNLSAKTFSISGERKKNEGE